MSTEGASTMSEENNEKLALVPRLRFPEFQDAEGWKAAQLDKLISTVTPPKKIPTTEYLAEGQFPIIDQGQRDIAGWTDDPSALIKDDEPLIIFGDHTCALKVVREPFAQGADGIKILKGNGPATTDFLYQNLCFRPVLPEEYKRHFSILKDRVIAYPEAKSGEQRKIADCLSALDELITAETQELDALKNHKKGLMQQLFPLEGESVPGLRFPEFRQALDWQTCSLGDVFETTSGGTPSRSVTDYWDGDVPWVTTSLMNVGVITEAEEFITEDGLNSSSAKLLPKGTVLIAMYGQGKTRGQVALLGIEAATNQACAALLPKDGIRPYFLFLNLTSRYEAFRRLSNSGGQENLSQALIRDFPFAYPVDEEEQQRIADSLSSLDDLITAQSQKIDALKIHKKGLMQQLFPVLDEVPA